MTQSNSHRDLDSIDRRLIAELETNPRQKYASLATILDINQTTVKRRLNRLLREGFISFASVFNTASAGYNWAMLCLNVSPGYSESIANELAQHTLMYATTASGQYDIMAWVTYKDPEMLFNFIFGKLGKISNITSIETFPALKVMKYSFNLLGNANYKRISSKINRQLDEFDWNILAELEKNPRITNTDLAKKLSISRQTASVKLQRLLDEGAIIINCVVSPDVIDYGLSLAIFIKTRPENALDVAEHLIANRSVNAAIALTGRYDLMVFAIFKSSDEMLYFLSNDLGTLPGIISSQIVFVDMKSVTNTLSVQNARLYLQNREI